MSIVSIDAHLLLISTEVYTASGNKPQMKAIVRTKPNLALVPCKLKTHLQNTTNSLRDQENWTRRVFVAAPIPCTKPLVRSLVAWYYRLPRGATFLSKPLAPFSRFPPFICHVSHGLHLNKISTWKGNPNSAWPWLLSISPGRQDTATPFSVSTDVPTISESLDGWCFPSHNRQAFRLKVGNLTGFPSGTSL